MLRKRPRISGTSLLRVLTGLAVLACSCSAKPSDSVHGTDASPGSGGNTKVASGLGGEGGNGSGGAAGATGGTGGNGGASQNATGGMGSGGQAGSLGSGGLGVGGSGSGGQAGSLGSGGLGVGGSGSGGASAADAAINRDSASPDLPSPDAQAKLDAATEFWTTTFVPNCTPPSIGGWSQSDGHHRAGEDCMQSGCHTGGSPDAGVAFLFGGTVRRYGSAALYPSVEVAVRTPTEFYSACSATNGNFWIVAADASSLDWNSVRPRVRSSNGEAAMTSPPVAGCNSCHSAELTPLTAP
jgi:hypothetical protein